LIAVAHLQTGTGETAMSEHKHGSMNIEDQEKAFAGFMRLAKNVAIFAICVLIFLAIFNT
jgi:hypothetical protein